MLRRGKLYHFEKILIVVHALDLISISGNSATPYSYINTENPRLQTVDDNGKHISNSKTNSIFWNLV